MPLSTKIVLPARTEEIDLYVTVDGKGSGSKDKPLGSVQKALDFAASAKGDEAAKTYRIGMGPGVSPGPYKLPGGRRVIFFGWNGAED